MKKPSRVTMILYGICAIVWMLRAILAVVFREYEDSVFFFDLSFVCAVIWIAVSIKMMIAYCFDKTSDKFRFDDVLMERQV